MLCPQRDVTMVHTTARLYQLEELHHGVWKSVTLDAVYYSDKLGRWPLGDIRAVVPGAARARHHGRFWAPWAHGSSSGRLPAMPSLFLCAAVEEGLTAGGSGVPSGPVPEEFEVGMGWFWAPGSAWQVNHKSKQCTHPCPAHSAAFWGGVWGCSAVRRPRRVPHSLLNPPLAALLPQVCPQRTLDGRMLPR